MLRKQVKTEVQDAHDNYVNNLIGEIKKDSKPFWKYINCQKSDKQGIPPLTTKCGSTVESDLDKAKVLNEQFTSVFTHTEYTSVPYETPLYEKMDLINITEKE